MQASTPRYLAPQEARAAETLRIALQITSTGIDLHIDWYPQRLASVPIVVINHGGGGHAGLFAKLALAFHAQGYAVAVPDQRGQGRSGGERGDFSVAQAVENIEDVVGWVRQRAQGPVYLLGSSIGGGLAYAAAAALECKGRPPAAVACINLYDFGDARTGLEFSRLAVLAPVPGLARAVRLAGRALAALAPRWRIPYGLVADFSRMLDDRDAAQGAYAAWQADPLALRCVSLRALVSLMDTPAAVAFGENQRLAVLVINPGRDRMVRPSVTRRSYTQLTGPKAYREIPFGHFSLQDSFCAAVVAHAHDWFGRHRGAAHA